MRQILRHDQWGLFFLNLVAGLFTLPFLYWNCILMRIVIRVAHTTPLLIGLSVLNALGGVLLLMFAALGIGGCLSAMRKFFESKIAFLPRDIKNGICATAKTSLCAGSLLGISLGFMRAGLVDIHTLMPSNTWRCALSVLLVLQFLITLLLCALAVAQPDETQKHPFYAFAAASALLRQNAARHTGMLLLIALPMLFFFVWDSSLLTGIGFILILLAGLSLAMLVWTAHVKQSAVIRQKKSPLPRILLAIAATWSAYLLSMLPGDTLRQEVPPNATISQTIGFVFDLATQNTANGTLHDLLVSSSIWPLLLVALACNICCVFAVYTCACYRFKGRKALFVFAVLFQLLPLLAGYANLDRLLENLSLAFIPAPVIVLVWIVLYTIVVRLLYRCFARQLPDLQREYDNYPGLRLILYYALKRAGIWLLLMFALVTLNAWNGLLAPFHSMYTLGTFSVSGYVFDRLSNTERLIYAAAFAAAIAVLFLLGQHIKGRHSALPRRETFQQF
ncbi:MAG: hypothetical protein LBB67_01835 [Oscillospiraceae bacterium]|jgi:hypothetical protein|nr:hypothetical protein [Oscillospiraceae bacterium]